MQPLFVLQLLHFVPDSYVKYLISNLLFLSTLSANLIKCLEKGLILFYLLFESKAVRITPPLTIKKNEIKLGCQIIINTLNQMDNSVH